jgi:hypothetical protein
LFDGFNGAQANANGQLYPFNFIRKFSLIPRIGLAVYAMDFEYSPLFSVKPTSNTSLVSSSLNITTSSKN